MYITLMIIAVLLGLFALLSISAFLWAMWRPSKNREIGSQVEKEALARLRGLLFRWTYFDYAIVLLFLCSMVFLVVDLAAVLRDREAYPFYRYGYLASGFIFSLLSMLFMLVRLGLVLSAGRASSDAPAHDHDHPSQADQAKHGVQG